MQAVPGAKFADNMVDDSKGAEYSTSSVTKIVVLLGRLTCTRLVTREHEHAAIGD